MVTDEDVVHVDEQLVGVAHLHFSEHVVHGSLEGGWGVCQSEEHYPWFKQPFWGFERGFPLVAFFDSDVVIPPSYVEFGEEGLSLELFQDRFDQGEQVVVADCLFI